MPWRKVKGGWKWGKGSKVYKHKVKGKTCRGKKH